MLPNIKTNTGIKTISIEARPIYETKKHLQPYLSDQSMDRQRMEKYEETKEILDYYASKVIEYATQYIANEDMQPTYEQLEKLFLNSKDSKSRFKYRKASDDFKKFVSGTIKKVAGQYQLTKEFGKLFSEDKSALYKNADLFGIKKEALEVLSIYNQFTSYFTKYFTSLSDVILCGTEYGSIAHRIMENMEYYWRNNQILNELRENHRELYDSILDKINEMNIEMCMAQDGIDAYNMLLGDTKNSGINSIISMYAQKNHVRIKLVKQLNKIPLVRKEKQVVIDKIDNDEELQHVLLSSLPVVDNILAFAKRFLAFHFDAETKESTYLFDKRMSSLSHLMYGNYNLIPKTLKNMDRSAKEKDESIISISTIEKAMKLIEDEPRQNYMDIFKAYMKEAMKAESQKEKIRQLCNSTDIRAQRKQIKEFYDEILHVRQAVSFFYTYEIENTLIEDMADIKDSLAAFNKIYNMIRNYLTQNPIQKNMTQLFFNKGTFLASFDSEKFRNGTSLSTLLRKDGMYYLYVLNPAKSTKLSSVAYIEKGGYDRLVYKQLTGVNKMFPKCFVSSKSSSELYGTPDEIRDIVKDKKYTKEANDRESCVKWIQFCIDSFKKNKDWMSYYNIPFKKAEEYESANDFYTQIEKYTIYMNWSEHLDEDYVRQSVADGTAFLFQLYNHDFSPYHTGKDGNYTRILKEVFSEENIEKLINTESTALKLTSGGAKLIYRKASIPVKETHKANEELRNKNPLNPKKTSTFDYPLFKDRRFMTDKFIFKMGVQLGFRNKNVNVYDLNRAINSQITKVKSSILTLRAGEEHLLYYMVTAPNGTIMEQGNLNIIESRSNTSVMKTDFKKILENREAEMLDAKQSWDYSVDVKDIKKGYVAYAVHSILNIRDKYDAIIFIEDYSSDFVNKRRANIKAVYQQFQVALLNKLSCYIPKGKTYSEAIQLSVPVSSSDDLKGQKGIVFFINPSYTANVDYTSGFCNQYYEAFAYENMKKASVICDKLDVQFDVAKSDFFITIKEDAFGIGSGKEWVLHTNGERSIWRDKKISPFNCTEELAELMCDYHLSDFKEYKSVADKEFFVKFFTIMQVLLKMHYGSSEKEGYFMSPVTDYDTRRKDESQPLNSSAVKTYMLMLKGMRDIERINEETLLVAYDEKGKHKENWLAYLQQIR